MVAPSKLPASAPIGLVVTTDDFKRLFARSSLVPAQLRTTLRRRILDVAKIAAGDVKAEVLKPPLHPAAQPTHRGLREGIAAGIGVSILTGNSRLGVQITSRGQMARAWDKPQGFRHRVFGQDVWVTGYGRPYFRDRIGTHTADVTKAVEAAMTEAVASLGEST
jgi:hypothetical protein